MLALDKAMASDQAFSRMAREGALRLKATGGLGGMMTPAGTSFVDGWQNQGAQREAYGSFRNWPYSVINVVAMEAAAQPVNLGRLGDAGEVEDGKRKRPSLTKAYTLNRLPKSLRSKAAEQELEILVDHPLLKSLDNPNVFQPRWQFVYSFIANLLLTGWSYIVSGEGDDGQLEFYSLPTTWVRADHTDGPYSKFFMSNPKKHGGGPGEELDPENVAFAYLPNPSDPLSAVAPASAQMPAIRIDDYIQVSQQQFFERGVFPSAVVIVGKEPHPDVPGGIRPRLSGAQRRQVHGAISRMMAGVANYGRPVILDGMVEDVKPFGNTEPEMGWARSEDKARNRILSAFGVHPFILGEAMTVGSYSQSAIIQERFCRRLNTYLAMLSDLMTGLSRTLSGDDGLVVWWDEAKPLDPGLRQQQIQSARANGDISQN